jgi:hypothetical protein
LLGNDARYLKYFRYIPEAANGKLSCGEFENNASKDLQVCIKTYKQLSLNMFLHNQMSIKEILRDDS